MLERVLREIPKLTDAVVRADVNGDPSYDVTKTGAADAVREAGEAARRPRARRPRSAKRTARQARKVPGVAQAEGQIKGAVASEERPRDRALRRAHRRRDHRQAGRALADRPGQDRRLRAQEPEPHHVLSRVTSLRGDEPWAGYDELTAAEVQAVLAEGDDERANQVRAYERAHKNRAGVLKAAERELTNA